MFKFLGIITGGILILIIGIACVDVPQAKKVSSKLHDELDQVIDRVAQPAGINDALSVNTKVLLLA